MLCLGYRGARIVLLHSCVDCRTEGFDPLGIEAEAPGNQLILMVPGQWPALLRRSGIGLRNTRALVSFSLHPCRRAYCLDHGLVIQRIDAEFPHRMLDIGFVFSAERSGIEAYLADELFDFGRQPGYLICRWRPGKRGSRLDEVGVIHRSMFPFCSTYL